LARRLRGRDWFHWDGHHPGNFQGDRAVCLEASPDGQEMGLTVSCDLKSAKTLEVGQTAGEVMPDLLGTASGDPETRKRGQSVRHHAPERRDGGQVEADTYRTVCEQLKRALQRLKTSRSRCADRFGQPQHVVRRVWVEGCSTTGGRTTSRTWWTAWAAAIRSWGMFSPAPTTTAARARFRDRGVVLKHSIFAISTW